MKKLKLLGFLVFFSLTLINPVQSANVVNYQEFEELQSFEQSNIELPTIQQQKETKGVLYRFFVDDENPFTNIAFFGAIGGLVGNVLGSLGIGGGSAPAPPIAPQPQYLPPPPPQNNNNNNNSDGGGMGGMMPMILMGFAALMLVMFMGKK